MKTAQENLYEEPIELPPRPFLDSMLVFGRDEATSGAINVAANTIGGLFLRGNHDAVLAATGLTAEKLGLFFWYFKEALDTYRSTPAAERRNISSYAYSAFLRGLPTLAKDVAIHDPLDYAFMYAGLTAFPETPTFLISLASFTTAVLGAGFVDVSFNEVKYQRLAKRLGKAGFGKESYLESRFVIDANNDPEEVLHGIETRFGIGDFGEWEYHDRYIPNNIQTFNGRKPTIRLRERISGENAVRSCQVVFTRSSESRKRGYLARPIPDQFRYFLSRKDKFYYRVQDQMPFYPEDLAPSRARDLMVRCQGRKNDSAIDVNFTRKYVHGEELLASVDNVRAESPFYLLELKVYEDANLLREAMRYAMLEYSPLQTTHNKLGILRMNGNNKPL